MVAVIVTEPQMLAKLQWVNVTSSTVTNAVVNQQMDK